jgi:glycosyltransferase involved in cell wall biosynthesis
MIVLLLVTQNEADLLRWNIRHHLEWGVDHIAVADNNSTDATAAVAREFGDAVSRQTFPEFHDRQKVRAAMLDAVRARHHVDWAGVADTDEFFWAPDTGPRDLLDATPDDIEAVNFDMKLFLPTTLDPANLPVFMSRVYRSGGPDSPLHTSYRVGKTFYRSRWLQTISNEHWCPEVPHPVYQHPYPAVHHYMIQDEDQFVQKVERLMSWVRPKRFVDRLRWHKKYRGRKDELPKWIGPSKREWWSVYYHQGEDGLREYYRNVYTVGGDRLRDALADGSLVRDGEFAAWARERFQVHED